MFSGIIEERGEVKGISRRGSIVHFEIKADRVLKDTEIGDSIAVNGVCLTVIKKTKDTLCFEVMPETITLTNLGSLRIQDRVNLERSLKIGDRISGHFVLGHIDCLGIIRHKRHVRGNVSFEVALPQKYMSYVLPKGSIALDGISLTVVDKTANVISVYVIPHTLSNTTLGFKGSSDKLNVEFDILTKRA